MASNYKILFFQQRRLKWEKVFSFMETSTAGNGSEAGRLGTRSRQRKRLQDRDFGLGCVKLSGLFVVLIDKLIPFSYNTALCRQ